MSACRTPCKTCPWRRDQHADTIPDYRPELAESLVATTSDQLGAPMFACHQSTETKYVICVGWLWRYGWDSITVRLRMMRGDTRPEELEMPPEYDAVLHESFAEMISKLREDVGYEPTEVAP